LNKILNFGKSFGDRRGLGYEGKNSSKGMVPKETMFVPASVPSVVRTRTIPVCHYCGIKGHIKPHCHKLGYFGLNRRKRPNRAMHPNIGDGHLRNGVAPTRITHTPVPQVGTTRQSRVTSLWVRREEVDAFLDFHRRGRPGVSHPGRPMHA